MNALNVDKITKFACESLSFFQKFSSTVWEQMCLEYFLFLGGRETYYGGEQCVLKLIIMVR